MEQQIGAVAAADARTRLARALYHLARDAGESLPGDGRLIRLTPTHATLAAHIGASRETVTRALAALEAGGATSGAMGAARCCPTPRGW